MSSNKTSRTIRVFLADDHLVVRMGIASLISRENDMSVVGEADDGRETVALAARLKPDIIIMDLMMPGMDGLDASLDILRGNADAKIILLTSFGTSPDIARALNAGVRGALLKSSSREEILSAIRSVCAGKRVISQEIEGMLAHVPKAPILSDRQIEVLNLAAKGFSNADIGKVLGISINSVKDHLKLIFSRLNVSTRAEATALAINLRLITG